MIRLEALKYLEEVAKVKSIGKAADKLFMSKSAMSTAIKILEEEIGVELLERSVYGVELTPAGKMVTEKAKMLFEIVDQIKAESWLYKGIDGIQEVHYYMLSNFSENIFPGLLQYLQQILGNIRMKIHMENSIDAIMDAIAMHATSIGFYLNQDKNLEAKAAEKGIVAEYINQYEVYAVMAKHSKYIKDNVKKITQEELFRLPMVYYEGSETNQMATEEREQFMNIKFSTRSNSLYYQALKNDMGVGMLLRIGGQYSLTNRNDLRYIPIENATYLHLYLLTNRDCPVELKMKHENILQTVLEK